MAPSSTISSISGLFTLYHLIGPPQVCLGAPSAEPIYEITPSTSITADKCEIAPSTSITADACPTCCQGFEDCKTAEAQWDSINLPYKDVYPVWDPHFHEDLEFPQQFLWGLGTASYQIEGAYNEDGRGASIWDTFTGANTVDMIGSVCKTAPCPVSSIMGLPGATGNVANNHYHLYDRDVEMLSSFGLNSYRFSVAWPRIFPSGHAEDGVNRAGVQFYHNLIDALIEKDIEPVLTLYHWDLPQGLLDAGPNITMPVCDSNYKQGWFECTNDTDGNVIPSGLTANTVTQFEKYAEFMFKEFGGKVKKWTTFNEAWTFTFLGSGSGKAPSVPPYMDNDIWPYVAGHNVILAHLLATQTFRKLQSDGTLSEDHMIGIVNNQDWRQPYTPTPADMAAAQVELQGQLGWFADPIYGVNGVHDYPDSMKLLKPYMPTFSNQEKEMLKQNVPDYFGLNHYGTGFAKATLDGTVIVQDGTVQGQSTWLYGAAWGFRQLLNWVHHRYGAPMIYVTEAGWSMYAADALGAKYDTGRLMYYYTYLTEAHHAISQDHINLAGFFSWSLMDNFEWERGYHERFGVSYTDFQLGTDPNAPGPNTLVFDPNKNEFIGVCGTACLMSEMPDPKKAMDQTRHAKNSLLWLQELWGSGTLPDPVRYFAATLGGDVCYGIGNYTVNGQTVQCKLSHRRIRNTF